MDITEEQTKQSFNRFLTAFSLMVVGLGFTAFDILILDITGVLLVVGACILLTLSFPAKIVGIKK